MPDPGRAALGRPGSALIGWRPARPRLSTNGALTVVGALLVLALVLFAIAPALFASHDPIKLVLSERLQAPSGAHPFGTDEGGRDIFSRVVWGTRNSIGIAAVVVASGAAIGVLWGLAAGLVGGIVDELLMRIVDVFLAFPAFVLAMAIAAVRGPGLSSVAIGLSLVWWPGYARLVRGKVLAVRRLPHVESARALGVSRWRLAYRHVLPFVWRDVNVRATTDVGYALIAVTALSFLGLGAQSPTPEWGLLIKQSFAYFGSAWWYMAFPGIAVMVATVAFSLVGDAIARERA
jgi:peptide/nickel transport system permease protein